MFAICIDAFSASRQLSSDLSEAKLFIALLKVLTVFLCSELCSLIVFASSSMSPDRESEFLSLAQLAISATGDYGQLRLSARHFPDKNIPNMKYVRRLYMKSLIPERQQIYSFISDAIKSGERVVW